MNVVKVVGGIFLAVGLAMLAGSIYLYSSQSEFLAIAKSTEGRVIDMSRQVSTDDDGTSYTYAAVVRFTDDNGTTHEFVNPNSSNPPSYSKGQTVPLLYAPDNPGNAFIDDFFGRWGVVVILGPMAAIFSLLGGALFFTQIYKARIRDWVRENGTPIIVDFLEVERDRSQAVNGRNPYRIVAQGKNPFNGKLEQFLSDAIWVDPTELMGNRKLRVFIDPNKPSRYSVDIDWLKEQIQD